MSNDNSNETYTLNSLVPEITGLSEFYDEDYDSARKQVYRISDAIRKALGNHDKGMPEITAEHKDSFVRFMRMFYEDKDLRKILTKYSTGKDVPLEELDKMIDLLVKNLAQDLPHEEQQEFVDAIEYQKDDESYEVATNIEKKVHDDLVAIIKLDNPPYRRAFLDQYNKILEEAFAPLRREMEVQVLVHDVYAELQEEARLNGDEENFLANSESILEFARQVAIKLIEAKPTQE